LTGCRRPASPKSMSGSPAISARSAVQRRMAAASGRAAEVAVGTGSRSDDFSSRRANSPGRREGLVLQGTRRAGRTRQSSGWLMAQEIEARRLTRFHVRRLACWDHASVDRRCARDLHASECPRLDMQHAAMPTGSCAVPASADVGALFCAIDEEVAARRLHLSCRRGLVTVTTPSGPGGDGIT